MINVWCGWVVTDEYDPMNPHNALLGIYESTESANKDADAYLIDHPEARGCIYFTNHWVEK